MSGKLGMRKWAVWTAALSMIVSGGAAANADGAQAKERDVMKNVGSYLTWNQPVTLKVGSTELPAKGEMENTLVRVPFRAVFEAHGAVVSWDEQTRTAAARDENGAVLAAVRPGSAEADLGGGRSRSLDQEAVLHGDSLLVPVRLLPESLGTRLSWDLASRTLTMDPPVPDASASFRVESPAYEAYGDMPARFAHGAGAGAGGTDLSIPLRWKGAPAGTKSYAVVMYDLHPIADNWLHWSVVNLPTSTLELGEGISGSLPQGAELNPYFGMGPPPQSGDHLYRIAVYALDTERLELGGTTPVFFEDLEQLLRPHVLASAEWDGYFGN